MLIPYGCESTSKSCGLELLSSLKLLSLARAGSSVVVAGALHPAQQLTTNAIQKRFVFM
jgi:hypothetical protein